MQEYAKKLAGVKSMENVTPETIKQAWKGIRNLIRQFYHLNITYQQENGISLKELRITKPWEAM